MKTNLSLMEPILKNSDNTCSPQWEPITHGKWAQSIYPALCTLAALSKKKESVYTLDRSNSSTFDLKKFMMNLASFFPPPTM